MLVRNILLVFLVFALFSCTPADDLEDESEPTTTPITTTATIINTTIATTLATLSPDLVFTEEMCSNELTGCCSAMYLDADGNLLKCLAIHASKMPGPDMDPMKVVKAISCFVECLYKQKKYIGKGDNLNMKMIKLDAQKKFAGRPKEIEYHIKMYEHCRKEAAIKYKEIKSNPAAKVLLAGACRPYMMFVFLCDSEYHEHHGCPYFRWEGRRSLGNEQMCEEAKGKCYEVDGIKLPESSSYF